MEAPLVQMLLIILLVTSPSTPTSLLIIPTYRTLSCGKTKSFQSQGIWILDYLYEYHNRIGSEWLRDLTVAIISGHI